jgi:hypothetical protein
MKVFMMSRESAANEENRGAKNILLALSQNCLNLTICLKSRIVAEGAHFSSGA